MGCSESPLIRRYDFCNRMVTTLHYSQECPIYVCSTLIFLDYPSPQCTSISDHSISTSSILPSHPGHFSPSSLTRPQQFPSLPDQLLSPVISTLPVSSLVSSLRAASSALLTQHGPNRCAVLPVAAGSELPSSPDVSVLSLAFPPDPELWLLLVSSLSLFERSELFGGP